MKDWEREAEIDASEAKFMKKIEEEIQEEERKKNIHYLVKGKYGIDDYYDWESK